MKEKRGEPVYIAPMPADLEAYAPTEDALKLLNERYLRKDKGNRPIETPEGMFWRVAYYLACADKTYGQPEESVLDLARQFYGMMARKEFYPNAPTLYNAGTGNGLQFSACFVLPIEDSMEGIYDGLKWQALIHKSGGGTGFAFSKLRPKDALVGSTRGKSSGPVSFLKVYNTSTEFIKQGGTRRGANMAEMNVHHPDILEFITCKSLLTDRNKNIFEALKPFLFSRNGQEFLKRALLTTQIANFNISVAATDEFMKAAREDMYYNLIDPQSNKVIGRIKAREVFNLIVKMAWETGDPGLWFIDKTNQSPANPIPNLMKIEATNPCGEQPLFDFDVCNLGSINLFRFLVKQGDSYSIDWEKLEKIVRLAVHFLDNVIDMNPYPLPQIMDLAHKIRRIGLGVMGWADTLTYLNVPYASDEASNLAEKLQGFINHVGHDESEKLAEIRGPFPLWNESIYKNGKPIRNCTITTIAPTGEIRILAGCSGGIEPHYGLTEVHHFENRILYRVQPGFHRFVEVAKARGFYSQALEEEVKNRGKIGDLKGIPEDVKKVFITAHEIDPEWHVKIQAAFQKHTDNGVSKTINLSHSATPEDIERVYWLAYESGCLGVTVFRDGCKSSQVLSVGVGDQSSVEKNKNFIRSRPEVVLGPTIKIETPDGNAFVTINFDPEVGPSEPFEVFINIGKGGTDVLADAEAMGRLVSFTLRQESPNPPIKRLVQLRDQLKGIGGSRVAGFGKKKVTSMADGIAKAIDIYLKHFGLIEDNPRKDSKEIKAMSEKDSKESIEIDAVNIVKGNRCPECNHATLIYSEGCIRCTSCEYTVC